MFALFLIIAILKPIKCYLIIHYMLFIPFLWILISFFIQQELLSSTFLQSVHEGYKELLFLTLNALTF
jgi:hypothetical protein